MSAYEPTSPTYSPPSYTASSQYSAALAAEIQRMTKVTGLTISTSDDYYRVREIYIVQKLKLGRRSTVSERLRETHS